MTDTNPLDGAIDRALNDLGYKPEEVEFTRDAILAEIEAEWPGIEVERRRGGRATGKKPDPDETRLVSAWRQEGQ